MYIYSIWLALLNCLIKLALIEQSVHRILQTGTIHVHIFMKFYHILGVVVNAGHCLVAIVSNWSSIDGSYYRHNIFMLRAYNVFAVLQNLKVPSYSILL